MTYYAVVNDLIGGYDVSLFNKTTGNHDHMKDEWTIGSFMSQEGAEKIAKALNSVEAIADASDEVPWGDIVQRLTMADYGRVIYLVNLLDALRQDNNDAN
jgi:hypothetical protein